MTDKNEQDLILLLATSSASLDRSPKKNWVQNAGHLPPYVRKLARAISRNGKSLDSAIAIAISRIKVWAAGGGDVNADTRAKAAKALAQWEALKAKNAAGRVIKATNEAGSEYILLSNVSSFNTEIVRTAWEAAQRAERSRVSIEYDFQWITELGTDYIIVNGDNGATRLRIPYTVDDNYEVTFGEPKKVVQLWVTAEDDDLTAEEIRGLRSVSLSQPLDRISRVAKRL